MNTAATAQDKDGQLDTHGHTAATDHTACVKQRRFKHLFAPGKNELWHKPMRLEQDNVGKLHELLGGIAVLRT